MTYNTIDLFSGCGGMTLGFSWAGFNSVFATDIDENCKSTFQANFPETNFICTSITEIKKSDVDKIINKQPVDVIIGGPPCQGFSLANKRRNTIKDDPRNKLFYEFVKFINWYKPRAFVMENVKGLLSMEKGEVIKQIIKKCENAGNGYNVRFEVLKASDFGVPQNRERVIIIGIEKSINIIPEFPKRKFITPTTVDDAISDLPILNAGEGEEIMEYLSEPLNRYQKFMRKGSKSVLNHISMKHTKRLIERFNAIKNGQSLVDVWDNFGSVKRGNPNEKSEIKFGQNNQRLHGDKPAPTIAASFQSNYIHPHYNRNFTAREGARLQSFPDSFIFKGMRTKMSWEKGLSQYQQIGNAVPPILAYKIALKLKAILKKGNLTYNVNKNGQFQLSSKY
jgi:DNA (cytosine-5)-methyltransferase 1